MTTIEDLKKKIANVDDNTPLCIGTTDIPLAENPTHTFGNGNQFLIIQSEIGFIDKVGYLNDEGDLVTEKVFIII